jgi:hypothetical protein
MRGRIALYAGKKKPAPAPSTNATTASCGMPTVPKAPTTTTDRIARKSASETARTISRRDTRSATMPPGIAHTSRPVALLAATSERSRGPPPAAMTA